MESTAQTSVAVTSDEQAVPVRRPSWPAKARVKRAVTPLVLLAASDSRLRAYFRGAREFVAGRSPRFVDQLIQDQHLDPKQVQLRQLCRAGYVLDGHIQMEDLQKFIDWSVDQKLTPAPVQALQLVDPGFAGGIRGV